MESSRVPLRCSAKCFQAGICANEWCLQRVLIALTQKGVAREDAYRLVQRNAMKVWQGDSDFLALLKKDPDVSKALTAKELEACFDLGYHLKHVDTIFRRVFGA